MPLESPPPPPLLVTPVGNLTQREREEFNKDALDIRSAADGVVISIPFPVAMYHRFDGVWIPVSDMGSFNAPHATPARPDDDDPSISDPQVACEDADDED